MTMTMTIPQLLEDRAREMPDEPAILSIDGDTVTYGALYDIVDGIRRTVRAAGIGRHDRVAVALPNGPWLATTILAVECSATCAVLNPTFREVELTRYLTALNPRALITATGVCPAARQVAQALGVPILELDGEWDYSQASAAEEPAHSDDLALLLGTSGTTADPKIVKLTHANILASAQMHVTALDLTARDRALNILPLYYCHGLNATLMPSLLAGGSVICAPGLEGGFTDWLRDLKPTWYSAVPSLHQAVLAAIGHNELKHQLRFVRSSSASLPPSIFRDLERVFTVPAIEMYGMAETASAPIACNPLPPRQRKPGSIGVPTGLEVKVMNEAGTEFLPDGTTGQIVVRGPSVMSGYDNPSANETYFIKDWFRTEDTGYFDEDGYLFHVGRRKELIVRGGERVPPRAVEEVLLLHPEVQEAAAFAVPHPTLGEDVAAACVLKPDSRVLPHELRQFAAQRLAHWKTPHHCFVVDQIPKGPTGKVRRGELARTLAPKVAHGAPRNALEEVLCECFSEVLRVERVGIYDDFFGLGGDSLAVNLLFLYVKERTDREFYGPAFMLAPTVADLAAHLEAQE